MEDASTVHAAFRNPDTRSTAIICGVIPALMLAGCAVTVRTPEPISTPVNTLAMRADGHVMIERRLRNTAALGSHCLRRVPAMPPERVLNNFLIPQSFGVDRAPSTTASPTQELRP